MPTDKQLVKRFQLGDAEGLLTIYQRYKDDLLSLAAALLNDRSDAEDVLHDVFVTLARKRNELVIRGGIKGYLATCIANRARDLRRRQKVRVAAPLDEQMAGASDEARPEEKADYAEQSGRLYAALEQLPEDQRDVVVLRHQGNLRFREIARMQQVGVSTVQGRYRYGIEKLRSLMNGEL